ARSMSSRAARVSLLMALVSRLGFLPAPGRAPPRGFPVLAMIVIRVGTLLDLLVNEVRSAVAIALVNHRPETALDRVQVVVQFLHQVLDGISACDVTRGVVPLALEFAALVFVSVQKSLDHPRHFLYSSIA